jgi:hypothetical protein
MRGIISNAVLISIGINAKCIYYLSQKFQFEGFIRSSILSIGIRMVDLEDNNEKAVKPLTAISGLNYKNNFGIRYLLTSHISIKLSYCLKITRIDAWDYFISSNDNLYFSTTLTF